MSTTAEHSATDQRRRTLLLIAQQPEDVNLIRRLLTGPESHDLELVCTPTLSKAYNLIPRLSNLRVILLDEAALGESGLTGLWQECPLARDIPVIVLTAGDDETRGQALIQQGAQDYLPQRHLTGPLLTRVLRHACDRKQMEKALRLSRDIYTKILASSPHAMVISQMDNDMIIEVNTLWEQLTGYLRTEAVGHTFVELGLFMNADERTRLLSQLRREGVLSDMEMHIRRQSGEVRHVTLTSEPLEIDGSRYLLSTLQDITEQRWMETALRESAEKYRRLVDQIPAIIYAADLGQECVTIFISPQVHTILGYPSDAFRTDPALWKKILHPDDRDRVEAALKHCYKTGDPLSIDYRVVARQGNTVWLRNQAALTFDPNGRRTFFQGLIMDITAQKNAEEQLRLQGAALAAAANGIIITDREGCILWANEAFARLIGYDPGEIIGQNPRLVKSGRQSQSFYKDLWDTILAGKVWHGKLVNKRKNGLVYTEEMTITPVRNDKDAITNFIAVKQDITETESLQQCLAQSQKMESIGRLAGGVAHDFNNLLQGILGFDELLLAACPEGDARRKDAEEIKNATLQAARLTSQLLAFSRKQMIRPKVVNLNTIIQDMQRMLQRLIGEDLTMLTELAADLHPVKVDSSQIEQIILNLTINARNAMPQGGRITIATNNITLVPQDTALIPESRHGQFVCLAVADSGPGIPPEIREHLFEPFYSPRSGSQGSGMGLPMVYGIAKQHDGWIHVYSHVGQGTTFKVYLPAILTPESAEATPVEPPPIELQGRGERILFVEDADSVRNLVARALESNAYWLRIAATGKEALALFEKEQGQFDMLLSDVVLPDLNGLEIAERLRARRPELKIILTSGYTDEKSRWPQIKERGFRFLQKPFSIATLYRAVREVLEAKKA